MLNQFFVKLVDVLEKLKADDWSEIKHLWFPENPIQILEALPDIWENWNRMRNSDLSDLQRLREKKGANS